MKDFQHIAVLGAGTIGMSWCALFLAAGKSVKVYDPSANGESSTHAFIEQSSAALQQLGWPKAGETERLTFTKNPVEAVQNIDFIQESIPEKLPLKHSLYQQIEPYLEDDTIVATSTSGLTLTDLQQGFIDPSRLLLAHPFNPPHLIPLVELMINERTKPELLPQAEHFYQSLGKETIRLNKEIPGHIANRLQAALWREAIHLVKEGVASVEDIDKAVSAGPGIRWAALGPNSLFHLGGGEAGLAGFCQHLGGPFQTWWNDLGQPDLDAETVAILTQGMQEITAKTSSDQLKQQRDDLVLAFLQQIKLQK